jgi:hypothetical protein
MQKIKKISVLTLTDQTKEFAKVRYPIILNHLDEHDELIDLLMLQVFDSDVLSEVPLCYCKNLKFGANKGKECPDCHTICDYDGERDINSDVWMTVPDCVDGFIMPVVYVKLVRAVSQSVVDWLLKPSFIITDSVQKCNIPKIEYLESIKFPRGLNNFIRNIDWFLEILPILNKKAYPLAESLKRQKHKLFPKAIPLHSRDLAIIEQTSVGNYAAKDSVAGAINAVRTLISIYKNRQRQFTPNQVQLKVVSIISNLAMYYQNSLINSYCKKKRILRGNIFSSRGDFTGRSVIITKHDEHNRRQLHVPWSIAVNMLAIHIHSRLMRKYKNFKYVTHLILSYTDKYHEEIHRVILELTNMNSSQELSKFTIFPRYGLLVLFTRNPTLDVLSTQAFEMIVKTDVYDRTIGMSVLTMVGPNADVDGDQMSITLIPFNKYHSFFRRMESHHGIHDRSNFGKLRPAMKLPATAINVIGNFINSDL